MTKGEQTRARIEKSAMKCFGKSGFYETSLDEIAKLAKIRRQSIINYYGDKVGLFRVCVLKILTDFSEEFTRRSKPTDSALDLLNRQFEMNLEMATEEGERARLILHLYLGANQESGLYKIYTPTILQIRARYEAMITQGIKEGAFKPILHSTLAAAVIHEIIIGMILNVFASRHHVEELRMIRNKWEWVISTFLVDAPKSARKNREA